MENFNQRLANAKNTDELAKLAYDALDDIEHANILTDKIKLLLDAGLTEYGLVDGEPWFWVLIYRETAQHLQVAKFILEKINILHIKYDDETMLEFLQSKVDYSDYNSDYIVRLFLLLGAYSNSIANLKMSGNLYQEMFGEEIIYSGAIDIHKESSPIQLDHKVFKNTNFYDWCIEMEEQIKGYYGCWHMHIFDKKSKIKIATYHC